MNNFLRWYFAQSNDPRTIRGTIVWWEKRRVPFNAIIGGYGLVSLIVFFFAIESSGRLRPGEDAIEPIALFLAPFVINILYTFGSLAEIIASFVAPQLSVNFGPILLKIGTLLGLILSTIPSAFWLTYRLVQLTKFVF